MKKYFTFHNILFSLVAVFSLLGLWASLVLSIESYELAKNSNAELACDINSVLSCASVMKTPEAELLGFPNSFLGLIGYTAILTVAVTFFFNQKINRWLLILTTKGAFGAFIFSYWLMYHSVFVIKTLCPLCLISCTAATVIFFSLILINLKENTLKLNERKQIRINSFLNKGWYVLPIALWFFLAIAIIVLQFKDRW